ncbi:hypothetical protein [Thermotoga sp. KOL6]|uniref:hypothetical protein n=1 Tax=Thermotoga sp. KOL6 TaxID=126741 RepID=UPI000C7642F7|nr:hypothetical protein [Thermotoga sp. KOL6]PLV60087.1 hypothetical protein AS005_02010 [Thermotoga sp. KOL6]
MLKLEASFSTIEKIVLKSTEGISHFSLSKDEESIIVKLKHGSFPFSISLKVKVLSTQKKPEDPVILKVGIPSFLMDMFKQRLEREGLEIYGNEIYIYPRKISKIFEDLIVSRLEIGEEKLIVYLEEV